MRLNVLIYIHGVGNLQIEDDKGMGGILMADVIIENEMSKRKGKNRKSVHKKDSRMVIVVLIILVWLGCVVYGTMKAKDYIDVSIKNVEQANAINLKAIHEQVLDLKAEIIALRQSIEATDSSLSSTGQLQQSIDVQLSALNNRLEELEASLKILKEAP